MQGLAASLRLKGSTTHSSAQRGLTAGAWRSITSASCSCYFSESAHKSDVVTETFTVLSQIQLTATCCSAPGTVKVEVQVSFEWNSKMNPKLHSVLLLINWVYTLYVSEKHFLLLGVFWLRLIKCRNVLLPSAVLGNPVCGHFLKRKDSEDAVVQHAPPVLFYR